MSSEQKFWMLVWATVFGGVGFLILSLGYVWNQSDLHYIKAGYTHAAIPKCETRIDWVKENK